MRLELTRVGLLVELANHYTTRGASPPVEVLAIRSGKFYLNTYIKKLENYQKCFVLELHTKFNSVYFKNRTPSEDQTHKELLPFTKLL